MTALDYFLKANLYGLLFASCYWLLLRRHTFFGLNRAYLLVSVLLTLTLPLVNLPTQTVEELPVPTGVLSIPIATLPAVEANPSVAETGPDWESWGRMAYALVAFGLLTRLIIQTRSLLLLIRRAPRQSYNGYTLVEINDATTPTFSFFRFIILNPADRTNDQILKHELIHVRQLHSVDVMSLTLLRIVFWACPTLWLLDRMLRQVHEFTADQRADQPTRYAYFLVEYSFGLQPSPLTNGFFNPSLLKQRIQMLHRQATTRWALGKYVLILPLALTLLAMTTAQKQSEAVVHQATEETITVSGRVTNAAGKPLVGNHFGVASKGKDIHRVIKSNPAMPREVTRVVNQIPAKQNGKAVAVRYQLPIRFALEKHDDNRTGQLNTSAPANKPVMNFSTPPDTGRKQASTVTIRGRGPLGQLGPGPLYILDGVEVPGDTLASMDHKTINSINALRDASAIAQYGEKGRNGVVIITTKKQ